MKTIDVGVFIDVAMKTMCDTIISNEVHFCELDSAAGDGDFGMSLSKGFKVIRERWDTLPRDSVGSFLKECGLVITEFCGGATGPLWGSAFRSAALYAGARTEIGLDDVREMLLRAVEAIQKRGGAKLGDKTMLDALIPAAESLGDSLRGGEELSSALIKSAQVASVSAESTKGIVAKKGRASYLGERSLQYPDAGAVAIGIILTDMAKALAPSLSPR
jgi:phosphoenolpyruvate---glycerone phosphotransferase subunit DhaL